MHFLYKTLNTNKKYRTRTSSKRQFPAIRCLQSYWIEFWSTAVAWEANKRKKRAPRQDLPGRLSGDINKHKLDNLLLAGRASSIMPDSAVCARAAHKRSETRCICKFCYVSLQKGSWFETYILVRNCQTVWMQFLRYWVQEFICTIKL
jgi:hypothetical protein